MHVTNDVLLLLLTPIVVVVLVVIYAVQSAANKILRIEAPKQVQNIENSRELGAVPPRHLTVLINPCSGSRKANAIFESLRPTLERTGLILNIIETTCKGQAYRVATQISQQECDGIVCVGGDGTVHEVVNGLLSRSDATIARHIPIAVIPCGSSNELAHTMGIHTPQQAAEKLIRGVTRPLDILAITSTPPDMWLAPGRTLYSFQGIGWGLTSEMISVAERLRWWVSPTPLSPLRLTLAAILTILTTLTLPRYSAKLMFLPLPTQNIPRATNILNYSPTISNTHTTVSSSSSHNTNNSDTNNNNGVTHQILSNVYNTSNEIDICAVNNSQCVGCEQPMKFNKGKRPSSDLKDWVVVDGKTDGLLFFTASNTPGKLSPHAHLSDGYMDISLITHCSRLRLTRLLMQDDKLKINEPGAEVSSTIPSTTTTTTTPFSTSNAEACIIQPTTTTAATASSIPQPLSNSGYHIRQYKTSQFHLEVDRSLPLIVDGELLEPPEGTHPLSLDVEVLRSMCYIVC